ncbi:MAG: ZIP family metal transporter [Cyanobacteria bacterium K_DeepCast_35m_m2_023]|nr:ZIP family metal transporter [Cyanobacteria bacterium K_DeepCast_35m_m2_023]
MVAGLNQGLAMAIGSLVMCLITLVGGLMALLPAPRQQRLLLPLIALAAGSLLGGALFHMLPMAIQSLEARWCGFWLAAGFTVFLALELGLHWHHSHRAGSANVRPVAVQIVLGDGLHNFIGGLGLASTFLINPAAGVAAWLAALAHELPQELGDYGVLVHSGWSRGRALRLNFISGLTFPLGALLAWLRADSLPLPALVVFAAGNFVYIAASDLVPEIKARSSLIETAQALGWFVCGLVVLWLLALKES